MKDKIIGLIGTGNMGEAIIRALIYKGIKRNNIYVYDKKKERLQEVCQIYKIKRAINSFELVRCSQIIILAVKPQDLNDVLEEIKGQVNKKIIISIAAGVRLRSISSVLGEDAKLVRAMPNICALNSNSATGIFTSPNLSGKEREEIRKLIEMFGRVVVLQEESLLDVVTGLSGSGPAFVFVFLEALSDAGVKLGLSRTDARILAIQTLLGSAKLAMDLNKHFAELKDMVASPGGTTMAGLKILEEKGFRSAVMDAVEAATRRARELIR